MKYITFTTKGSVRLCENFLLSARNVGIENDVTVYCLDKESFDVINLNYSCTTKLFPVDVSDEFHEYGKDGFRRVTEAKIQIILNALQDNQSLVYSDCDVVFKENPTELILAGDELINKKYNVDIYFSSDHPHMNICTGFMYIKNTEKVHSLFKKYFELSSLYGKQISSYMYDQEIINEILTNGLLKEKIVWSIYPPTFVVNGDLYWNEPLDKGNYEYRTGNETVIHCNFVIGEENKINRLKEANLWYVKEEIIS